MGLIIKFGSSAENVDAAVIFNTLWLHIERIRLNVYLWYRLDPLFASCVRAVGEERISHRSDIPSLIPLRIEHLADSTNHFPLSHTGCIEGLKYSTESDLSYENRNFHSCAILTTTTTTKEMIYILHATIIDKLEHAGTEVVFPSADSIVENEDNCNVLSFASSEHLLAIKVPGVPAHKVHLESGALSMIFMGS